MNQETRNEENEFLDVTPGMITYNLFENFPYTMTRALCEFIDNALHAFLEHREKMNQKTLDIQIKFFTKKENKVEITDNGAGIFKKDFQKSFELAKKKEVPGMSEFGVGMKAAAFWFASRFTVTSTPYDSQVTYFTDFNLDELIDNDTNQIVLRSQQAKKNSRGVSIVLSKLRRELSQTHIEAVWSEIQDIYQLFTHVDDPVLNLSIYYNNISLSSPNNERLYKYREPDILIFPKAKFFDKTKSLYAIGKKKKWEVNINFKFEGKPVVGRMCLLETSSQTENPGLRLFRENRLLKGFFAAPYRPVSLVGTANKHAPSRVFAELHLNEQPISVNKADLLIDETLFLETLKKQKGVKELLEQAEAYRAKAKPIEISEDEYKKLENKRPVVRPKKAILTLYKNVDHVFAKTDIDLLDYVKFAANSKGENVPNTDIIIEIDGKQQSQNFRRNFPSEKINITYYFYDDSNKIDANLELTIITTVQPANIEKISKPLIPHVVHESYSLQLGPILPNLVSQINELYKQQEYIEIITCGLRSCFEIPLYLIRISKDIKFDSTVQYHNTEQAVLALHGLLHSNPNSNKIAELIVKQTSASSQKNLLNQYKGISKKDVETYIKQAHLGAHGSTTSLTRDKIEGLGDYIGLFLLVADQILNNKNLQQELGGVIPKPIF